jgi:hypothetical protein
MLALVVVVDVRSVRDVKLKSMELSLKFEIVVIVIPAQ